MMRQVFAETLGRNVSVIGFGCASLGSRISRADGLSALGRAHDQGVTWFDVAPPYGDGAAETILGEFLKGKRDGVAVCTKVGIAPPSLSLKAKIAKPILRAALKLAPGLREKIARNRPASVRAPINAAEIETSVARSLKNLGVDYVDVLALHEPSPHDVHDEEVMGALQRVVDKGYARAIGVAGDRSAAEQGVATSPLYRMMQYADGPFEPALAPTKALRVTHSVFGVGGALARLTQAIAKDEILRGKLQQLGFEGSADKIAASTLMDFALSNNANGVVLASMFRPEHMTFNIDRANRAPNPGLVDLLQNHDWDAR